MGTRNKSGKPDEIPGREGSGVNHWMDRHLIQGGGLLLPVASYEETRIISSGPGQATAQIQTLPNCP